MNAYFFNFLMTMLVLGALILLSACGGESVSEKAAEKVETKVAEKMMEKAMSQDGKKVDVDMNAQGQLVGMKVKGEAEQDNVDMKMSGSGDNMSMTVTGANGAITMNTGANAKIPENFPKDIVLYPGIKPELVQSMDGDHYVIQASTTDGPDKVVAHFKKEFAAQGWTEQMTMNQGGEDAMQMLNYQKAERTVTVMIIKETESTKIHLTTGKQ